MKTISKALVGTVAAGAMAISAATPAQAQYRDYRHNDGISTGDIIAGAVIIGGIAAIASAASRNNGYGYGYGDRYGYDNGNRYGYRGDPRQAVEQCVSAATREASRYGQARVTRITQVRDRDYGWEVKGDISVGGGYGNRYGSGYNNGGYYGGSNDRYGYGYNNDRYGYGYNNRGYGYNDTGSFKCRIDRGRVYDVDFSGLRGL